MLGMKFLVPDHLQPETGAWWHQVMSEFELEAHRERLLTLACQAWDRGELARQVLAKLKRIENAIINAGLMPTDD